MSNGFSFQEISKIINKAGKVSNIFRTIKYLEIRKLQNLSLLTKNQNLECHRNFYQKQNMFCALRF